MILSCSRTAGTSRSQVATSRSRRSASDERRRRRPCRPNSFGGCGERIAEVAVLAGGNEKRPRQPLPSVDPTRRLSTRRRGRAGRLDPPPQRAGRGVAFLAPLAGGLGGAGLRDPRLVDLTTRAGVLVFRRRARLRTQAFTADSTCAWINVGQSNCGTSPTSRSHPRTSSAVYRRPSVTMKRLAEYNAAERGPPRSSSRKTS